MALNYASSTTQPEPRVSRRTILAGLWLIALLYATYFCFRAFANDLDAMAQAGSEASVWLSPSVIMHLTQQIAGPLLFAMAVGLAAAAILWHWPTGQLKSVALLPTAAGLWRLTEVYNYNGTIAFMILLGAILQIACVYAGTRCGRRVARFLAHLLLPPGLAAALIPLWIYDPPG